MNRRYKYLISAILVIIAFVMLLATLSPFLLMTFNSVNPSINNAYEVPMRVVGANYPIYSLYILAFSFIVGMLLLFLYAKRKKTTSALFWINGISISLIIAHIVALMELLLVMSLVD